MRRELEILTRGELYQAKNSIVALYDSKCDFITHINSNSIVLLVDNRYFFMNYDANEHKMTLFKPFSNLENAEKDSRSYMSIFIKVVFNNVIGYANFQRFVLVDKT